MNAEGIPYLRHALTKIVRGGDDHTARQLALMFSLIDGQTTVRALAEHLHVDKAVISRNLDRLEVERLVARKPDPENGRSILIVLTHKGQQFLNTMST